MSYIAQSLGDGETVIRRARFHWLYTLWAWACMLLPLVLLVSVLAGSRKVPLNWGNPLTYVLALGFVALLAGVVTSVQMLVLKWTTEIAITSHRFVEKRGLFTLRTGEIALPNIEGVKVRQSLPGRIFGYGTITIEGTGVDSVTTPHIADPIGFVKAIQTAKEHVSGLTAKF